MVPEMLFLHGLRTFNRSLWYRSFPFHFGLYLLAVPRELTEAEQRLTRVTPGRGERAPRQLAPGD